MAANSVRDARSTDTGNRNKETKPLNDMIEHMREYAQEKPEGFALWCLGIGFVLGWKLKPWSRELFSTNGGTSL